MTAPAVADEIAGAAELAQGKLGGRPFAVVRGRADLVLPPGDDGPGARALVRPDGADLFGYGAREAVVRRAARRPGRPGPVRRARRRRPSSPPPCATRSAPQSTVAEGGRRLRASRAGRGRARSAALAFAHGWAVHRRHGTGETPIAPAPTGPLRRLCPSTASAARLTATEEPDPWPRARQVRPPGDHRADPQEAEGRRAPPRLRDRRRLRVIALLIVGAAAFQPIKDWWTARKFQKPGPRVDRRVRVGLPGRSTTKKATGNRSTCRPGTPITYTDAPPAFGPHWNEPASRRPDRRASSTPTRTGPSSSRWCTTSSTATRSSGTTRPIADDYAGDERDPRPSRTSSRHQNFRDKFIAAPWTSADEDGKAFPDGQHIALTHWSAGGAGDADAGKQVGVWQYCSDASGAALEDFMPKYPYPDSPEPNAA